MTEKVRPDKTEVGEAPPPSYHETVGHGRPPGPEACLVEGGEERAALALGGERLEVRCGGCGRQVRLRQNFNSLQTAPQVLTTVRDEIKPEGWFFAICCFFCGSWCASCLVFCLPGFKKFSHFCPSCGSVRTKSGGQDFLLKLCSRALVGVGEPSHLCAHILLLFVVTILVIALSFIVYFSLLNKF